MAHQEGQQNEHLPDNWFSGFEEECLEDIDNAEANMEETVQRENDVAMQKLFLQFQNSATAIAQLYKDVRDETLVILNNNDSAFEPVAKLEDGLTDPKTLQHCCFVYLLLGETEISLAKIMICPMLFDGNRANGLSLWIPFQNAASSVTTLYKDSVDSAKHCMELGLQRGKLRHTKDIVSWVKKRRRHIRREDLLAFLCGKHPPPQRTKLPSVRHGATARMDHRQFPRFQSADSRANTTDPDLQCFREAIALQGLDGAMSNISVGFRPHSNPSPTQLSRNNLEELNTFIIDEFSRNCDSRKRSATPDVTMDSPSRKKNRLF